MLWPKSSEVNSNQKEVFLAPKKNADQNMHKNTTKFVDIMRSYCRLYCEKSSVHGVRYIYDPTLRSIERLIWGALVITSITLTAMSYAMLVERYAPNKLQTVLDDFQYPVFIEPFPAVGICVRSRIDWRKFEKAKKKFLNKAANQTVIDAFAKFVVRMESLEFGHFQSFANMENVRLEYLDGIDVTKLAEFMAMRCEDIITNGTCTWRRLPFDCCEGFVMEPTEAGFCLMFNSMITLKSQDKQKIEGSRFYPFHNAKAGQGSGLSFMLSLNGSERIPNSKLDDTVTILIKQFDEVFEDSFTISPNTETYLTIQPEVTESDKLIRSLNITERNCYFEDEKIQLDFKQTNASSNDLLLKNCYNICHAQHVLQYCNCTLPMLFPFMDAKVPQCRPSSFRCLAKHNEIFSNNKCNEEEFYTGFSVPGMTCNCLMPCNRIEFFTVLTTLPLSTEQKSYETSYSLYHVNVHYQNEVTLKYRTTLEFTSIDLIANLGGIFSLCLGASLVSAVELFYYLTVGFGQYVYNSRCKNENSTNNHNTFNKKDSDILTKKEAAPERKENNW